MKPLAWQGRRVLITGHTGFKGAWLSLWLASLGARVYGYALAPPTQPSLYEEARVAETMAEAMTGDVRDLEALRRFAARVQPEAVFHFAAQSLVRASYESPIDTFSTNVVGTVNLLEALRPVAQTKAVVVATTDKCYENDGRSSGYKEGDRLGGSDPYSSSKACAEIAVHAYRASFFAERGAAIATVRAGNVIGGGDWSRERLMTDIVAAFAQGRPVRLRHPDAVRPWQHVLDSLHGYLTLAAALLERGREFAQAWNFGPADADARPVSWIAETAARLWGAPAAWERDAGSHPHESKLLSLDAGKARRLLGWRPLLGLEEALGWSIEWYREHRLAPARAHELCSAQLKRFADLAAR